MTSENVRWIGIDHVQVAIPAGSADAARAFYVDVLGLAEVPKPAVMATRGECPKCRAEVDNVMRIYV